LLIPIIMMVHEDRAQVHADPTVGRSERLRAVLDFLPLIAGSASPVLITGEAGTGKKLMARIIHDSSPRANARFVAVRCATLTDTQLEWALRCTATERGTLYLDDIDDLPLPLQLRLLDAMLAPTDAGAVSRRVVAGSKRDIRKLVAAGTFRPDLYDRLNVVPIQLPPLHDTAEEIPQPAAPDADVVATSDSLDTRLAAVEAHLIRSALRAAGGNKSKAAALLKVKRSTLGDRIKKLGLQEESWHFDPVSTSSRLMSGISNVPCG
jgi:DNA-binding NtrC family response regulator